MESKKKGSPRLKNDEERLKYLTDINNWEELGTWDILKEKDGNPLFKLMRMKGTDIYHLMTYNAEYSLDWWIEGMPHHWPAGYTSGWTFELDGDGRLDRTFVKKSEVVKRMKEIGL